MKIILLAFSCISAVAQTQTPVDLLAEAAKQPQLSLEQIQQLAAAHNPTLKQAAQAVARSAAQARQAAFFPNPSVGYQGEQIRGGYYGGGEQGGFIQQTIPLGGKLGLRSEALKQQRRQDELGVSEQQSRVKSDIGQLFYRTLAGQELVKLRRDLLAIARDAVTTSRQLANVGQSDLPDVLLAEVDTEQAEVDYTTAQLAFIQEFRSLAAVAGQPDLALSYLSGDLEAAPSLDTNEITGVILRDSPEVKKAQQAVLRVEAELKSAHRESIPDLTIRGGLQQNLEHLNEYSTHQVGLQGFATAGITLPLFNRNQGNIESAKADLERARQDVTRLQLSLRSSIQPLLQTYLSEKNQSARYRSEMIPRAERAYRLYLSKYQSMAAAYPQVLLSQRTLFQLKTSYIQSLSRLWSAAVQLQNFVLSNGLEMPSTMSPTPTNLPNAGQGGGL
jgi:outer membrane protein, heavy metal efflux system